MIALRYLWALFALVALGAANDCCPQMSPFHDVECITRGADAFFSLVVKERVIVSLERIQSLRNYEQIGIDGIKNIELRGLVDCIVRKLALDPYTQGYEHCVHCPELISTFYYTSKDDPLQIVKKCTIIAPHYDIVNVGQYGINVHTTDYRPHFFIQSVHTYPDPKQEIACYSDGVLLERERESLIADLKFVHYMIVSQCMYMVIADINVYFRETGMGNAFPKCNADSTVID